VTARLSDVDNGVPGRAAGQESGLGRDGETHRTVTVMEACRVVLPGSRLAGGAAGVSRRVTWATTLRSRPPAFELRGGGEFVFASQETLESLRQIDSGLTLVRILEGLAQAGGVALAVPAGAAAAGVATADALGLPLVEIPRDTTLLDAERGIIALVLDRHNELQTRASQLYRQLAQVSVESLGLDALIREAAVATRRIVALEDHQFRVRAVAAPPDLTVPEPDSAGLSSVDERGRLVEAVRAQPVSSTTPPATLIAAARWGLARYVAPVVTRERLRGYVSICAPADSLTEFDQLAASRAAAICAMEMAKDDAVLAAEQRVQGDLVDELLRPQADPETTARRAQLAGLTPGATFGVVVVAAEIAPERTGASADSPAPATVGAALAGVAARFIRRGTVPALAHADATEVVVVCELAAAGGREPRQEPSRPPGAPTSGLAPRGDGVSEGRLREIAGALLDAATQETGAGRVSAGVSRPLAGLPSLPQAGREAREALRIGRRVYGPGRLVSYADLGLYRVLHALRDSPELRTFYEQTLGPLVEYDRRTGHEAYIETLEAFFACHGNISQTAQRLQMHRNAVLYRIGKIQEIGGVDLEDPEARLSLQVALKARRLLSA
jgi:purine catabolism regulator